MPWLDLFICWIGSFLFPADKIASQPANSSKGQEFNQEYRCKFDKQTQTPFKMGCKQWSKAIKEPLVQCTWKIPRQPELLSQWGIIDAKDELLKQVLEKEKQYSTEQQEGDDCVTVHVFCPASLVLKEGDVEHTVNDCGCVEVELIDLKKIALDVPIILWFHGGGLTLGSCDFGWDDKILPLLQKQKQVTGSDTIPPVILASVEYRLAPEYPLPAASIDALSVLEYCFQSNPQRKIHVSGESAGGYLSVVCAFAAHKPYPGRITSALVMIPFLSPASDSMSYYMNGSSSIMVKIPWLRWCWCAALELQEGMDDNESQDVLAIGSNRTAWNKSKWKENEQWRKFLEPLEGIPSGLDKKENTTKYIVAVNKADPLYDDGDELMKRLTLAGADVDYIEAKGSHSIGYVVDRKGKSEMIESWRTGVFQE